MNKPEGWESRSPIEDIKAAKESIKSDTGRARLSLSEFLHEQRMSYLMMALMDDFSGENKERRKLLIKRHGEPFLTDHSADFLLFCGLSNFVEVEDD